MRPRRRRHHRGGTVGPVRPRVSGRSEARLLAGETGRSAPALRAMSPATSKFVPFELERWQSTWENRVRFNLSESGVHPLTIHELLGLAGAPALPLLEVRLHYSQSNGTDLLRERIAALYPGASPDQVLVTSGSAEANFCALWRLIDADEVRAAIAPGTKLVVVTNPHNPTGHVLSEQARTLIAARAAEVGAWLLSDEVYQGAERTGTVTRSNWGASDKVVVVNGLSKAYGLPGLRLGWLVGPPAFAGEAWARHDYTTIGPSGVSDHLGTLALESRVREKLLERTRRILVANYPVLEEWLKRFGDAFTWTPPDAGAICFAKYKQAMDAPELAEKLRAEHGVLLCPGDHFGMP